MDEQRNVTPSEDSMLRAAARRSAKVVSQGMMTMDELPPLPALPTTPIAPANVGIMMRSYAAAAVAMERERICAAIKAEDDHCAAADYMLDSDDCIKVARGQWVRPEIAAAIRGA